MDILLISLCFIATVSLVSLIILRIQCKREKHKLIDKRKVAQCPPLLANFHISPDELAELRRILPLGTKSGTYLAVQAMCTAVNHCMIDIEATGLTMEEALEIPRQLEKAIIYASYQQLHEARFTAFQISREPDGEGGWVEKPEGYADFRPKP